MSRANSPRRPTIKPAAPGSVRIIAGRFRGRRLPVADLPGLRPTPDRVRETVFNWLAPMIEGSHCLDLFAGSGVLGFEAASRGAAEVWMIERDPHALAMLRNNVVRLDTAATVQVHGADALDWLRRPPPRRFDLVFVDPPYADRITATAFAVLHEHGWLSDDAWLYCEWPQEQSSPTPELPWRSARAGRIVYALYRNRANLAVLPHEAASR